MRRTLRGAIIGLGNVAVHGHVPGWRARGDVEIAAVADAAPGRRATAEEVLPGARWYDSTAALLADVEPDFVDICSPPLSHAPLVRQALERGAHVLCEKPLVASLDDLSGLAALAAGRGRVLHTVHNWHHAPIVAQARALVADGAIGRVTGADWQTLRMRPAAAADGGVSWRIDPLVGGGGVLTDHGWHVSYILHGWLGAAPTAVSARLETRRHTGWSVEDTATVRVHFPEATADVFLTWAAEQRRNWARLTGTEGVLELRDDTLVLARDGAERRWTFAAGLSDGSHHPDWFGAVAERFLAATRGEADAATNLAEALVCLAVETGARESSERGGAAVPLALPGQLPPVSRAGAPDALRIREPRIVSDAVSRRVGPAGGRGIVG